MRNVIVVVDAADLEGIGAARYERLLMQIRAEVAALEVQYARASAERHDRFQQRLESTRKELRETRTRLEHDIDALEHERDDTMLRLREQLERACPEARGPVEQRLAEVHADYRVRIGRLTRAWALADSAITG